MVLFLEPSNEEIKLNCPFGNIEENALGMATNHVILISSICDFLENDNRIIKRGATALHSNNVEKIKYDSTLSINRGEVHASMKDKVYKVEVRNNLVSSILITLPALEECDAILAKECLWNKPTTKEETEVLIHWTG
ncbi:hypothetical protein HUJ05_001793 [Dendroctonus ponderosae]|nr:hypothetical protein HUJ05_001793 [Dendroctonus ponderosae]